MSHSGGCTGGLVGKLGRMNFLSSRTRCSALLHSWCLSRQSLSAVSETQRQHGAACVSAAKLLC